MPADLDATEFWLTFAAFLLGIVLVGLMVWIERRPRTDINPRLMPTTPFMFAGALIGLLALVHLLNLWGIHTGR